MYMSIFLKVPGPCGLAHPSSGCQACLRLPADADCFGFVRFFIFFMCAAFLALAAP